MEASDVILSTKALCIWLEKDHRQIPNVVVSGNNFVVFLARMVGRNRHPKINHQSAPKEWRRRRAGKRSSKGLGCFGESVFFSAPLRFALKTSEGLRLNGENNCCPIIAFWTTVSLHDAFSAHFAHPRTLGCREFGSQILKLSCKRSFSQS